MLIILMYTSFNYGVPPGTTHASYAYAPNYDHCRTEGFKYAREEMAKEEYIHDVDIVGMACIELDAEESKSDENAVNAVLKVWNGLPRK